MYIKWDCCMSPISVNSEERFHLSLSSQRVRFIGLSRSLESEGFVLGPTEI